LIKVARLFLDLGLVLWILPELHDRDKSLRCGSILLGLFIRLAVCVSSSAFRAGVSVDTPSQWW
jgi:hypothetical protein